ncbi:HAD family hydrolase [Corynebacterium sp. Q4381]|uniref:HAD family hydrolase n=1 Tax=Corynebacterium sp. Marseille-Q4381 TaxID=3121597 RepID=UPI002FE5BCCE
MVAHAQAHAAAFFDLDKTIIATSSAFAFGKEFLHNGMISRSEAWDMYWSKVSYMLVGQSSDKMDSTRDSLAEMVAGWDVDDVARITEATMRTVVTPAIYAEARELIDEHKRAGHDVIIISASAKILVEPIARELGVDTVVATEMSIEDGKLTGEITSYLKGEAKADAVRAFAADNSYVLQESFAYSDSATDIPMLSLVGHPTAVNPDRALKKHALSHGWPILSFKNPEPLMQMPNAKEVTIGAGVVAGVAALILGATLITRSLHKEVKGPDATAQDAQ